MATKGAAVPFGMPSVNGVTAIEVRSADVTVRVAVKLPALMVVVPTPTAVATPWLPGAFEMVATFGFELAQVRSSVRSTVDEIVPGVPLLILTTSATSVSVAVKGTVAPFGTLGAVGDNAIVDSDLSAPFSTSTVRTASPLNPVALSVAVMVKAVIVALGAMPDATRDATPDATPVESIVATAVLLDFHVTAPASEAVVPSLKMPVARKDAWVPVFILPAVSTCISAIGGVTATETSVAAVTVTVAEAVSPE
jgi:hypothetical protein